MRYAVLLGWFLVFWTIGPLFSGPFSLFLHCSILCSIAMSGTTGTAHARTVAHPGRLKSSLLSLNPIRGENTNSLTNSLPSVIFHQVAAPKPSMHFFFLLYILYTLPIYFPVILSPKQHLVRSTNYGTAHNAVLTSPVYLLSVRPNCVLRYYYINISDQLHT